MDEISDFFLTIKMGSYTDTWKIYENGAVLSSTMMNCPCIVNTELSEINIGYQ